MACGVKNPAQMCDFIGIDRSSVSKWKTRKNVPNGSILKVSEKTGASIEWIKTGQGKKISDTVRRGVEYIKLSPEEATEADKELLRLSGATAALDLLKESVIDVVTSLREKGQINDWPASRIAEMVAIVYQGNWEDKEKKAKTAMAGKARKTENS